MQWQLSDQCNTRACLLADRHYSRKTIGAKQFMPPGRMLVLLSMDTKALWGTSWPYPHLLRRTWATSAWMCSIFRNESHALSSELIREAVAVTRWKYGDPPVDGMVTIIDQRKVRSVNPGFCYKKAGFKHMGYTKKGLVIVQMLPHEMPEACMPYGAQFTIDWRREGAKETQPGESGILEPEPLEPQAV